MRSELERLDAGDASVFAGGDATLHSLAAAGLAEVHSLNSVTATINTPGSLTVTASGDVAGFCAAGGDLSANAGGSILASIINAGRDAHVTAIADIGVSDSRAAALPGQRCFRGAGRSVAVVEVG